MIKTPRQKEAIKLLSGQAKRILLRGGSRSGKTLISIYSIFIRALKKPSRHVIFRFRFNHAKASIWYDTMPKLLELMKLNSSLYKLNKQDLFIEFANGSTIWIAGLDDKDRTEKILGNEFSTIYFNECSQISYNSVLLAYTRLAENSGLINKTYFDCNPPPTTHWVYKLFMKGIDPVTNLPVDRNLYDTILMNPEHNLSNLPKGYIEENLATLPDRQKRRFLNGEFVDDIEGALWKMDLIDKYREPVLTQLKRIVIAIDPAVTSNPDSDETGIIICGIDENNHGWVFDDVSGIYTPNQWAERAVFAYNKYDADRVIGEVNNGGDLVEANLRTVNKNISYIPVHAFKGKYLRAEPVAALYEQGKVHHVGNLSKLEDEMTTWDASSGQRSPNRLDALVYGLTYLMLPKNSPFLSFG